MSTALSLYHIEDDLVAMLNSIDMVEDPAQRAEVEQEIIAKHLQAVDKRDRVSQFLAHCDNQEEFITAEINRLSELRKHYSTTRDRVEKYVVSTIIAIGKDDKGKWRKLEGKTCSFGVAKKPITTEIDSLDELPDQYKDITVKMAADHWADFVNELDIEQRAEFLRKLKSVEASARKSEIKKALEAGVDVTGARFGEEGYRLNRK
jgi:hypothetical protein